MVSVGYALSCGEFGPREAERLARLAQQAGFERLWISDHRTGCGATSEFLASRKPCLRHGIFEAVGELVTEEMVAGTVTCGVDPHRHLDMVGKHIDAGFDEIYVQQIGPGPGSVLRGLGETRFFRSSADPALSG